MPWPAQYHYACLIFLHLFCATTLIAQKGIDLHQFDGPIDSFSRSKQRDSFLYFIGRKLELAKKSDSLELWGWTSYKAQRFFAEHPKLALKWAGETISGQWRNPENALEAEPFLYLQVHRANHYYREGLLTQAQKAHLEALKIFEQYRYADFEVVESIYKPLGANYIRLGDNEKAIAIFQKALSFVSDRESLAGVYANIGIAFWNQGDYHAAENTYRKGLILTDISRAKRGLLLGRLAETMLDQGRTTEAAHTAKEAIRLLSNDPQTLEYRARAGRIAGIANTRLGKFVAAEKFLNGALADDRTASGEHSREAGKDYIALSQLFLHQGLGFQALNAADQSLAAVLPQFKPCYPSPSIRPLAQSNPKPDQFYEENTIFEALGAKAAASALIYELSGETPWLEYALDCHELAWQAESLLRGVFQYSSSKLLLQNVARAREESAMNVARILFEKTTEPIWLEKGFAIAERSKAALLLEAVQDNLLRQGRSGKDPRFGTLTVLRQSLSYFDKNLLLDPESEKVPQWRIEADEIRSRISALESALRKEYPNLYAMESRPTLWLPAPGDFSPGEAMVEYFLSADWMDVFVFQKDQKPYWARFPNDAILQALVRQYLSYFENDYDLLKDPAGYFQIAFLLGQKLIPPESSNATLLTIFPDGLLNFVPFEALLTANEPNSTLRNAAYLIRQKEVRYAWSLTVLRHQKNLRSGASNYLLSIAPGFSGLERGLAPLAPANYNWGGIKGWNVLQLSGEEADLQGFMKSAGDFRVLHFSTHAFADGNPRIELIDSSLLLPDLYALSIQADLVLLSACQTSLGKEEKGEGVMSLARAFAQAGAACIVSSLWSVNDHSTTHLLHLFYDQIGEGKTSAAALREAKLAYLSDPEVGGAAQSPYFWAGLVVVGDNRAIVQPWGWSAWGTVFFITLIVVYLFIRRLKKLRTSTRI